ncbi:MAG TPA: AraC family transcriptional regulator ligand-binding domain-containing protein, partial [Candidatus Angelobacter sp.]|nr:AraC family transcriptional regulator ligand-binding domain-containing protein [Candidatus Angelobacter sp.]
MGTDAGEQRVGILVELPHLLRELGADPAAVVSDAGLDPDVLLDPENVIPFLALGRLLQRCVEVTQVTHFGLPLGQKSVLRHYGLVGQLMRNAPNLGTAMGDIAVNQRRYVRGSVPYLLVQGDTAFWGYAVHAPSFPAVEQLLDVAVATGIRMMWELAEATPDEVMLSRLKPADPGPYYRMLGPTLRFDADQTALAFSTTLLQKPVLNADPRLRRTLDDAVSKYWAVAQPNMGSQVVRILRPRLVSGLPTTLQAVAEALSIHPRTLDRRLS